MTPTTRTQSTELRRLLGDINEFQPIETSTRKRKPSRLPWYLEQDPEVFGDDAEAPDPNIHPRDPVDGGDSDSDIYTPYTSAKFVTNSDTAVEDDTEEKEEADAYKSDGDEVDRYLTDDDARTTDENSLTDEEESEKSEARSCIVVKSTTASTLRERLRIVRRETRTLRELRNGAVKSEEDDQVQHQGADLRDPAQPALPTPDSELPPRKHNRSNKKIQCCPQNDDSTYTDKTGSGNSTGKRRANKDTISRGKRARTAGHGGRGANGKGNTGEQDDEVCGNCGRKGHMVRHCLGPVDLEGWLAACPGCNTKGEHLWDECHARTDDPFQDFDILVDARQCKPPIKTRLSCFGVYADYGRRYKMFMPQTTLFALRRRLEEEYPSPVPLGAEADVMAQRQPLWMTWAYEQKDNPTEEARVLAAFHGAEDPVPEKLPFGDNDIETLLRDMRWVDYGDRGCLVDDGRSCVAAAAEVARSRSLD